MARHFSQRHRPSATAPSGETLARDRIPLQMEPDETATPINSENETLHSQDSISVNNFSSLTVSDEKQLSRKP